MKTCIRLLLISCSLALLGSCSSPMPNTAPIIQGLALQNTGEGSVALTFRASDPDRDPITCAVNWGDGTAAQDAPCVSTNLPHSYQANGPYLITIRATDPLVSTEAYVNASPGESAGSGPQIVSFSGSNPASLLGSVRFTATDGGLGGTLTCTLNWGDNTPDATVPCTASEGPNATHTYARPGDYAVLLTVTAGGQTVSRTLGLLVAVGPEIIEFSANPDSPSVFVSFTADDRGLTGLLTCTLNWGDGTVEDVSCSSNKQVFLSHRYTSDGTYTVSLTVKDKQGLTDVGSKAVIVFIGT